MKISGYHEINTGIVLRELSLQMILIIASAFGLMSELFGFEGLGMFVCIDDLPRDFATALRVEVEVDAIGFFFVEACGGNLLRETSFSLSASPKIGLYASTSECPGPGDNGFQSGSEARDFS